MQKALIYARVSTDRQETENQIIQLKRYCESQSWEIVEVITDVMTGAKGVNERAGLNRVFTMAHKRHFDILLFWSLDRLSREGAPETIRYLTQLENSKCSWHSYSEPFLSSMGIFSDAIISLLATLAKQERIRLSERTRAGMARVRKQGIVKLGRPRTPESTITSMVEMKKLGLPLTIIGQKHNVSASRVSQLITQWNQQKEGEHAESSSEVQIA